jgi:hypothetical protein
MPLPSGDTWADPEQLMTECGCHFLAMGEILSKNDPSELVIDETLH